VLKTLNEAQARWYVARETLARGRGGPKAMHQLTGLSRPTILKGIRELQQGTRLKSVERVRATGSAYKPLCGKIALCRQVGRMGPGKC
jgi:hypothetical protein